MLDNSALIEPFVPEREDGDTFIYTEMLDRGQRKGNNGQRLLKTFYHRSREEFREQLPTIRKLCDLAKVRACTRLAPRSYKLVGVQFTRLVVETALTENWAGMKSLYNRAMGISRPIERRWLWDVDAINEASGELSGNLRELGVLIAVIPSKKGEHLITQAFDVRTLRDGVLQAAQEGGNCFLHRDNPTNLYIPDDAD